jgi:osmotically-inducible protein OsmY
MFGSNDAGADKALQKLVNRRLERSGAGTQSGLTALVQRGSVTLSGKLHYEAQRLSIVKALRGVSGVRNVIDQLQSPPKKKP